MGLSITKKIMALIISVIFSACAAPPEPAALQKAETPTEGGQAGKERQVSGNGDSASAGDYEFGGALIGTSEQQSLVKKCVDQGKFFERSAKGQSAAGCTSYALEKMNCTDAKVGEKMTQVQKDQFNALVGPGGSLDGYKVDQCMDCSSPTGNSYCEGTAETKQTAPGIRVFLAKETATVIDVKSIYLNK